MQSEPRHSEPRARHSDPQTSKVAAKSVGKVAEKQDAVLGVIDTYGPLCDGDLILIYKLESVLPRQSHSGIRTRRNELVDRGLIEDSGERKILESGRSTIIWRCT